MKGGATLLSEAEHRKKRGVPRVVGYLFKDGTLGTLGTL